MGVYSGFCTTHVRPSAHAHHAEYRKNPFCTMMYNQTSWYAMEDYAEIHQKDMRKLYFKISAQSIG